MDRSRSASGLAGASTKANIGSPTATPAATALSGAPGTIDWMIGMRLRVTNCFDEPSEGNLYAYDPVINTITLQQAPTSNGRPVLTENGTANYLILKIQYIKNVEVLAAAPAVPQGQAFHHAEPRVRQVNVHEMARREAELQNKERERLMHLGKDVSEDGQNLYDEFRRQNLPVRWYNKSIIVAENVIIEDPYALENCKAADRDAQALKRIQTLITSYRQKLEMLERRNGGKTPIQGERRGG